MQIVEKAANAPGQCIFTNALEGPFLDLKRNVTWIDPYAYVAVSYVKEMGRAVGMIDPGEVEGLKARIETMGEEIEELRKVAQVIERYDEAKAELEGVAA